MSNYPDPDIQTSMADYHCELEKDEGYQKFLTEMDNESRNQLDKAEADDRAQQKESENESTKR